MTSSTSTLRVDRSNENQARTWDGAEGASWAEHHEQLEAVLADYQPAFAAACDIGSSDRVLDIGCGTGSTTRMAARAAARGSALGVDLSSRMVDVGRTIAASEGLDNIRLLQADAQVHAFAPASVDVAISRTGAMFFGRPDTAFANIARAMRPGARLTLLTWQPPERNEWFGAFAQALTGSIPILPSSPSGPFSMSDPDVVRGLLQGAGFQDVHLAGHSEPVTYGRDPDHAHALLIQLLGWMLEQRAPEERVVAATTLHRTLGRHHGSHGVQFDSATWLVTARKPERPISLPPSRHDTPAHMEAVHS